MNSDFEQLFNIFIIVIFVTLMIRLLGYIRFKFFSLKSMTDYDLRRNIEALDQASSMYLKENNIVQYNLCLKKYKEYRDELFERSSRRDFGSSGLAIKKETEASDVNYLVEDSNNDLLQEMLLNHLDMVNLLAEKKGISFEKASRIVDEKYNKLVNGFIRNGIDKDEAAKKALKEVYKKIENL